MFERSIELVMLWLRLHTSDIRLVELLYTSIKAGSGIFAVNKFQCFILTEVSGKNMIMIILKNTYAEITSRWYINSVIKKEKTIWVYRPLAICGDVFCSN